MSQEYTEDKEVTLSKLSSGRRLLEALLIVIALFAVWLMAALHSFNPSDPSWSQTAWHEPIHNLGGAPGAWLADTVRSLVNNGIPVCAHMGLTPQSVYQLGGFKVQAKTEAAAEQLLASLQSQAPAAPEKPVENTELSPLKRAKIELAMRRAELKKAEKALSDDSVLVALRNALVEAEHALHAAEDACGKPAPELVRTDKQPVDEATRALKTELAFARADLRKLERDDSSDAAVPATNSTRASTRPWRGRTMPSRLLISVVLPMPLRPISAMPSPSRMWKSRPCRM